MQDRERYERWIADTPPGGREGIPAATVILIRDALDGGDPGVEVLMLRRNSKLAFVGGMWVFPGGRVDDADRFSEDEIATARRAAVRESREEAGLEVDEASLETFSHWTPPAITPKRFLTWFFLARAPEAPVTIDEGEIKAHRWIRPSDALARKQAGEIDMVPPTWITLERLARYNGVEEALAHTRGNAPEIFETRIVMTDEGPVALYEGDAGYADDNPSAPGERHRLEMREDGWVYRRDDWTR